MHASLPWRDMLGVHNWFRIISELDSFDTCLAKPGLGQGSGPGVWARAFMTPRKAGFDLPAIWQAGKSNPYRSAPKVRYVQTRNEQQIST